MKKFCEYCGKVYETYDKRRKFCSKSCYNQFLKRDKVLKNERMSDFIEKAIKIHGNKYDYSMVDYMNCTVPIKIICKKHGVFEQAPKKHLIGHGCPKCAKSGIKYTTQEIVEKFELVHKDKYDYSLVEYINSHTPVKIICKKHAFIFEQLPYSHLQGHGCPICRNSKGELYIREYLDNIGLVLNHDYFVEYTFNECRDKFKLPFDFYIPSINLCIEFQGLQHYRDGFWKSFSKRAKYDSSYVQRHDDIKRRFCQDNSINLLEIDSRPLMKLQVVSKPKLFEYLDYIFSEKYSLNVAERYVE